MPEASWKVRDPSDGLKEFKAKENKRQPVSPIKLLLSETDGCGTQRRIV